MISCVRCRRSLGRNASSQARRFAVKALSWCASPSGTPNRDNEDRTKVSSGYKPYPSIQSLYLDSHYPCQKETQGGSDDISLEPIDKFGVVAAMARNRVMGVNGKLPWNLPEDRKNFVNLTRDRVLIMGRRTYEESPTKSHICHAKNNIVVSRTMDEEHDRDILKIARSFPEALHIAKTLVNEGEQKGDTLECWIVGGERIYNEALNHPAALELHLTIVDMNVDVSKLTNENLNTSVALFPAKYRWDRHFNEVQRSDHETTDGDGNPLKFTQVVYRRKHT